MTANQAKSLRDGNGRTARLARWLAGSPPDAFDTLMLESRESGEWSRIQCWPRSHVGQGLAVEIDAIVQDAANELGAYLQARVAWYSSERESYWTEHALRVHPEDMGELEQAFSGDPQSATIQTQRHLERREAAQSAMSMQLFSTLSSQNEMLQSQSQAQFEEIGALRRELGDVKRRCNDLEAENTRLMTIADEALTKAEAAEQNAGSEEQSPVMQMVTQALMAQLTGAQATAIKPS